MKPPARRRHLVAAAILAATLGCEDPHNDMGQQDKYLTYQASGLFPDGTSARPIVAGAVTRNPGPGTDVVALDTQNPLARTIDTIQRGQSQFDIFCSVCHGRLGNGQGMVVYRGLTRPPSFHMPRLRDAPDAHFYNVITQGYGAMFSYDDRIAPDDRWAIVHYIRALQAASLDDRLSEEVRAALIAGGDPNAPRRNER